MAKFVIFFVAALAFHAALAAPKKTQRTDPNSHPAKSQIEATGENVVKIATEFIDNVKQNLPDNAKVAETLTTTTQQFATGIENVVRNMDEGLRNNKGAIDKFIRDLGEQLTQNTEQFKQFIGTEHSAKANEIKTNVDAYIKGTSDNIQKFVDDIKPELERAGATAKHFVNEILQEVSTNMEHLRQQVDDAIARPTQAH